MTFQSRQQGFTLIELLFVLAVGAALVGLAVPVTASTLDAMRVSSAARYMASRLMGIRMDAVRQSTAVALRFEPVGDDYVFTEYRDGNGNGIRTAEIVAGVDRATGAAERLSEKFAGVRFGLEPGIPDADGSSSSGTAGVRVGSSGILTMTPEGTSSSGTLYLRGRGGQYAVRILGATGRVRVLYFHPGERKWHTR